MLQVLMTTFQVLTNVDNHHDPSPGPGPGPGPSLESCFRLTSKERKATVDCHVDFWLNCIKITVSKSEPASGRSESELAT